MMLRWFLTGSMLLALAAAPPRAAAGPLGMTGTDVTSPDGVAYTLYTGKVASFDGVPLDVDLTVPQGPISPRPLLVMMHGWGGSKTDWESPRSTTPAPTRTATTTLPSSPAAMPSSTTRRGASTAPAVPRPDRTPRARRDGHIWLTAALRSATRSTWWASWPTPGSPCQAASASPAARTAAGSPGCSRSRVTR